MSLLHLAVAAFLRDSNFLFVEEALGDVWPTGAHPRLGRCGDRLELAEASWNRKKETVVFSGRVNGLTQNSLLRATRPLTIVLAWWPATASGQLGPEDAVQALAAWQVPRGTLVDQMFALVTRPDLDTLNFYRPHVSAPPEVEMQEVLLDAKTGSAYEPSADRLDPSHLLPMPRRIYGEEGQLINKEDRAYLRLVRLVPPLAVRATPRALQSAFRRIAARAEESDFETPEEIAEKKQELMDIADVAEELRSRTDPDPGVFECRAVVGTETVVRWLQHATLVGFFRGTLHPDFHDQCFDFRWTSRQAPTLLPGESRKRKADALENRH